MELKQIKNFCTASFDITKDEFESAIENAYKRIQKDVSIKGFRKGHVPQKAYENAKGVESLFPEAIQFLVEIKFDEVIASNKAEIVAEPTKVELDPQIPERGKGFKLTLEIPTKPEVELEQYKGLEVEDFELPNLDEQVEKRLEEEVNKAKVAQPKEDGVLENGDIAIFDFEGFSEGKPFEGGKAENYELEIGSNKFIPGFEEQMLGLKVGEEKDLNVTFPEQYQEKSLAGKPVVFKVKLHDIKVNVTPELNDEFAKSLNKENVTTLAELKDVLRKEIKEYNEQTKKDTQIQRLIQSLGQKAKVELHQSMIDREVNNQKEGFKNQLKQYGMDFDQYIKMLGKEEKDLDKEFVEQAKIRLTEILALQHVAELEKFEVSLQEIEEKLQKIANYYKVSLDEIKKYVSEQSVKVDIMINKAIDFIYDNKKIVKPKKEENKKETTKKEK